MTKDTQRPFFGRDVSAFLDIIRFVAAIAVAASHMQENYVGGRVYVSSSLANAAVCVFFVLSGFVIRYVTLSRESTATEYWIDRASRIYSVVLPAILITILFEGAANIFAPGTYHTFVQPFSWARVPFEVFLNGTFLSGFWGYGERLLGNGVFWSLTYECIYYVLYGLMHYRVRGRWILISLLLVITGPSVAVLYLVWLLGVLLFDLYEWMHRTRASIAVPLGTAGVFALLLVALRHPIARLLHNSTETARTAWITQTVDHTSLGHRLFHGATLNWLDRLSVSFFFTGAAFFFFLLIVMPMLDRYLPAIPKTAGKKIRFIADGTFTLYLVHLPFLILFFSLLGHKAGNWGFGSFVLLLVMLFSIALAAVFDRLKNWMRARLRLWLLPAAS